MPLCALSSFWASCWMTLASEGGAYLVTPLSSRKLATVSLIVCPGTWCSDTGHKALCPVSCCPVDASSYAPNLALRQQVGFDVSEMLKAVRVRVTSAFPRLFLAYNIFKKLLEGGKEFS